MISLSQKLNNEQFKAVQTMDGPILIAAGPGTGKTRTFAHRVSYLLNEKQIPCRHVLAVTFTRSAANEMKERLKNLGSESSLQNSLATLWLGTFHAVALRILSEQGYPFGLGVEFSVITEEEKRTLLAGLLPRREIAGFLEKLRGQKQKLTLPQTALAKEYQNRLSAGKWLDFDDLFIYALQFFREKPEVLGQYRKQFRYVLVDEFQDTSFSQYQLMRQLASENICAIGDQDQAIFGFTDNSFRPFEQFRKDYPDCALLSLSENYRSQATILEAAKQVIRKNRAQVPRELHARLESGLPVEINGYQTEQQEAELIVRKIESLLGGGSYFTIDSQWAEKEEESYRYGFKDIAILYRFHAQAKKIASALDRAGLPYKIYGKKSEEDQDLSLTEECEDFQNDQEGAPSLVGFPIEAIRLMTLHRSKGLEFPVVFLSGCEEGVLPCHRQEDTNQRKDELEEERRLFYVGMTRVQKRLFISYAKKRFLFGKILQGGLSRFVLDIEEKLRTLQENKGSAKKRTDKENQLTFFS